MTGLMTAVGFRSPWIGAFLIAALAAGVAYWRWRDSRPTARSWKSDAPLANLPDDSEPAVRRLRRRHTALIGAEVLGLSTLALAAGLLAMRPLSDDLVERETMSRDVMLCLDVSGSMKLLDRAILRQFAEIAAGLPGDRVGLTIWNASAITVFPLTDDTRYIDAMLDHAIDQLDRGSRSFTLGTEEGGASLIGDGLASCALRFDRLDEERARSILFATDNELASTPIMSLLDAAAFTAERDIVVYAVAPTHHIRNRDAEELERAAQLTGGEYLTTDERVVDHVIERISAAEATRTEQAPETVRDDRPTTLAAVALAALGLLSLIWTVLRR